MRHCVCLSGTHAAAAGPNIVTQRHAKYLPNYVCIVLTATSAAPPPPPLPPPFLCARRRCVTPFGCAVCYVCLCKVQRLAACDTDPNATACAPRAGRSAPWVDAHGCTRARRRRFRESIVSRRRRCCSRGRRRQLARPSQISQRTEYIQ